MVTLEINKVLSIVPNLIAMPYKNIWYSYDEEADVLYLNFKKPSHADDSEMTDDDVIIRYEKGEIIGITILSASKRNQKIVLLTYTQIIRLFNIYYRQTNFTLFDKVRRKIKKNNYTKIFMKHFKRNTSFLVFIILLLSCYNIGCGRKESGTQPTARHATSIKLEGEAPSAHKKSMVDEEIEKNKKLLESNPNDAKIHYSLGLLYEENGMFDESLAAYKKASELNPTMIESLVGQGAILNKKGKSDEAVSVFKKAIEINPHYADAYEGLGLVYIHKKQEEDAVKSFNKAIEINPGLVNSRYNLGILYAKKAQFNEAIAEWTKGLEINPQKTEIYYNLGIAYTKINKFDDAISVWQKALTVRPDMATFHYNIGLAYKEKGDLDNAEASLKKTLEIDPVFIDVHKVLEEVYRSKGMLGDADREAEIYKSKSSPHH